MNTEKELRSELHDRVDGLDASPISFDDVIGTAGRIRRRRRRVTAGVATLAAAAVLVPSAMFGGSLFDDDAAPQPARPGPAQVHDAVLDPSLPEGDPPRLAYVDADRLFLPSGQEIQLEQVYGAPRPAGDEHLAAYGFEGGEPTIDVLDADWQVTDTIRTNSGAVSSADGTVAAWIAPDGTVVTRFQGRSESLDKVTGMNPQPVAIVGHDSCMEVEGGCRVFVNLQDGPPVSADSHGIVDQLPGGFTQLAAVSGDQLLAGRVTPLDADPMAKVCSVVFDEQAMEQLFRTCDLDFAYKGGFSPDGSKLVGSHPESDGAGPRDLTVVDARTGITVVRIGLATAIERNTSIVGADWEDDDHLLVRTQGPGTRDKVSTHNLFRVGLDGSVERLLERDHDNGTMTQPWLFVH